MSSPTRYVGAADVAASSSAVCTISSSASPFGLFCAISLLLQVITAQIYEVLFVFLIAKEIIFFPH